ncbi:PatB family C-S lyase [Rhizobium sp. YS-1r]|uniref:MalY/PatB family protein n=1 Tax=Rhizobium sp. YS-1r TaxID=1532558 RepID=UPI00050EA2CF|nr:PatB family C-S lyase [Rhizobium sp. YS-1r]KGE02049.1 amino acid aminotransferase [Rhizobium sp. YS-1r]
MDSETVIFAAETGSFEMRKPELLERRNAKWRQYPSDVIPAFVADMDFRIAPAIQRAIQHSVEAFDYGYPMRDGGKADCAVASAFVNRMKNVCDWDVAEAQVLVLADLVQAIYASVMAFSDPGDGVIVQMPSYPPFRDAIATTGRTCVPLTMQATDRSYVFDLEALEATVDANTKIFMLCNPQNPTGRAFTRDELLEVLAFVEKHDLIVISDEIHSDLVYHGTRHIPFASLSPSAAARTVTLNSATKSFNIPGLRCAVAYFGTEELMQRFHKRIPVRLIGSVNSIGIDATVAAWTEAQPWLDEVLNHLKEMRDHVVATLRREIPGIRFQVPDATYLIWLDCSDLGIEGSAFDFFLERARIGFSPGEAFHPECEKFVRMNFATSKPILDEMLDRMITAVRSNRR